MYSCVEAGKNTPTTVLRVVEGDEKGTQCLGLNWASLSLGNIWSSRLEVRRKTGDLAL
jgi:hypothetical protein